MQYSGEKNDEVKETTRVRREAHARCSSRKATNGRHEYAGGRKEVKKMEMGKTERKMVLCQEKEIEDFGGWMKQICFQVRKILDKQAAEAGNGTNVLGTQSGREW